MPKMEYICQWNEVWAIYIYIYIYIFFFSISSPSREKKSKNWVLERGFCQSVQLWRSECQMRCWVQYPCVILLSGAWRWILQTTPFARTPFSWMLTEKEMFARPQKHQPPALDNQSSRATCRGWCGSWGSPKGPLFEGASFKTQVDRLPTATRTCKWPASWRLHLQMGFATTEPWLAGLTFQGRGGGELPLHWAIHFPVKPHWAIHFPVEKSAFSKKPL